MASQGQPDTAGEPERSNQAPTRLTARGEATRQRIVRTASELIRARGVGAVMMEDIALASGASKSQLYRHFPDKSSLVLAVIDLRADELLGFHGELLGKVRSVSGLQRWRNVVVGNVAAVNGGYGCMLGSIATEIADDNPEARASFQRYFRQWAGLFVDLLERMIQVEVLDRSADPQALAQEILAALEGGYVLSQVEQSSEPMGRALDMAIERVAALGR